MVGKGVLPEEVSMQPAERISRMNTIERIIACRSAIEKLPAHLAVKSLGQVTRKSFGQRQGAAVAVMSENGR